MRNPRFFRTLALSNAAVFWSQRGKQGLAPKPRRPAADIFDDRATWGSAKAADYPRAAIEPWLSPRQLIVIFQVPATLKVAIERQAGRPDAGAQATR
jgi:hypothetical protein